MAVVWRALLRVRSAEDARQWWHAHKLSSPTIVAALRVAARARTLVRSAEKLLSATPSSESSHGTGGVPLFVTAEMRAQLLKLGHAPGAISAMTPVEACLLLGINCAWAPSPAMTSRTPAPAAGCARETSAASPAPAAAAATTNFTVALRAEPAAEACVAVSVVVSESSVPHVHGRAVQSPAAVGDRPGSSPLSVPSVCEAATTRSISALSLPTTADAR